MAQGEIVDFQLTQESALNEAIRLSGKIETLEQHLELLKMRLAIQEDFTLAELVNIFDTQKKGFVTESDIRRSFESQAISQSDPNDIALFLIEISQQGGGDLKVPPKIVYH